MPHSSTSELLALHAVRLKGFVDSVGAARRFGLDPLVVEEHLLDAQARGWVTRSGFGDSHGWSLTDAGRAANEADLARELDETGSRAVVEAAHAEFLPLNAVLTDAATRWQLRPTPDDPFAENAHDDRAWDAEVLTDLGHVSGGLRAFEPRIRARLERFGGYDDRFAAALVRAHSDPAWVAGVEVDSCHRVWFELHEDFLATLGIAR